MNRVVMKEQDLLELYQLLCVYRQTYYEEAGTEKTLDGWIGAVSRDYGERTRGKDIREGRNPRKAGRKKIYGEEQDDRIRKLYKEGFSIRNIAKEACCSPGHVQDVLRAQK